MVKDFNTYSRRQTIKGKSLRIGSGGFLGKAVGIALTGAMICGLGASVLMGWMIRTGLDDLAQKQSTKEELVTSQQNLDKERAQLLAKNSIARVVDGLGLYPATDKQIRHF